LGGKHWSYPSFNGQFAEVVVGAAEAGLFVDTPEEFDKMIGKTKKPADYNNNRDIIPVVKEIEENNEEKAPQ
jgi:hypothetical protein